MLTEGELERFLLAGPDGFRRFLRDKDVAQLVGVGMSGLALGATLSAFANFGQERELPFAAVYPHSRKGGVPQQWFLGGEMHAVSPGRAALFFEDMVHPLVGTVDTAHVAWVQAMAERGSAQANAIWISTDHLSSIQLNNPPIVLKHFRYADVAEWGSTSSGGDSWVDKRR